jgi:hypothetical protein
MSLKDLLKQTDCMERMNLIRLLILLKQNQKSRLQSTLKFFIMEIIRCFHSWKTSWQIYQNWIQNKIIKKHSKSYSKPVKLMKLRFILKEILDYNININLILWFKATYTNWDYRMEIIFKIISKQKRMIMLYSALNNM